MGGVMWAAKYGSGIANEAGFGWTNAVHKARYDGLKSAAIV